MEIIALVLLGTLAGNELAVGAFVHPTLSRLSDENHAAAVQALGRVLGKVMPFWFVSTFLAVAHLAWHRGGCMYWLSSLLVVASVLFTFWGPLPINHRVVAWDLKSLPSNWKADRRRWDRLHAIRILITLAALVALACGVAGKA